MPSSSANARACSPLREPTATTLHRAALCMPGTTFFRAMSAVERMPQRRTRSAMRGFSSLTRPVAVLEPIRTIWKKGTQIPVRGRELVGQRSETVRRANLSAIARELHGRGALSRSELVARTGLTRSAIRGLISEFVAANLALETRSEPDGLPGRPSPLVQPRREAAVVLALEIAVDSLAAAIVGLGGTTIEKLRIDLPRGHSSVEAVTRDLVRLTGRLRHLPRLRPALLGVGVAIVGVVRRDDGQVSTAPNLGWRDVPLGARLTTALDVG